MSFCALSLSLSLSNSSSSSIFTVDLGQSASKHSLFVLLSECVFFRVRSKALKCYGEFSYYRLQLASIDITQITESLSYDVNEMRKQGIRFIRTEENN